MIRRLLVVMAGLLGEPGTRYAVHAVYMQGLSKEEFRQLYDLACTLYKHKEWDPELLKLPIPKEKWVFYASTRH